MKTAAANGIMLQYFFRTAYAFRRVCIDACICVEGVAEDAVDVAYLPKTGMVFIRICSYYERVLYVRIRITIAKNKLKGQIEI